jgi:fructose-1,6-bisphosphatase I
MHDRQNYMTLDEFTIQQLRLFPHATGELSGLLRGIGLAAKRVNAEVKRAGLADILGEAGKTNVQGEDVQKLDLFANNEFIKVLKAGINCAGIVSEENKDIIVFDDPKNNQSKYVLLMDPLDGSGNIDVNNTIGTIFSVYRRVSELGKPCLPEDFLQPGVRQVAAGYIIYGSSTMLVYATKRGVNGFTLDDSIGEFYHSFHNLRIPESGWFYSFDHRYYYDIDEQLRKYIHFCMSAGHNKRPYSHRYAGCMLADIHRNLIKGGIFFYPAMKGKPEGKLRLMYECNPVAFIIEVAGGKAISGEQRILEILPQNIHQRTPVFIGSKLMIEELEGFLNAEQ